MDKQHNINRRDFLKIVGISTLGATASLYGCSPKKDSEKEGNTTVPVGKMTYRNFPPYEDKVSLLVSMHTLIVMEVSHSYLDATKHTSEY